MPRRTKPGLKSEAFQVRWHSVANIATPSADIMSSPDPLNDTIDQSVVLPSSTRRVPRSSQRSSRFSSLGTSPRKQTFELEVGDDRAPQRLLVTVETEEPSAPTTAGPGSARRKLFQTSSPLLPMSRRREMATTTTVPLKKPIEEEMADPKATPRRRGRPRKTNGTPLPGAGTKRKSGTPLKRTPRRPRTTKDAETGNETAGSNKEPTPGTKRRGRPPKNRPVEPSGELGDRGAAATGKGLYQGPEHVADIGSEAAELPSLRGDDSQVDNEMTLIITPSEAEGLQAKQAPKDTAALPHSEPDSDIWMATLDDDPTPRPSSRAAQPVPAPSSPVHEQEADPSDFGDYGYLAPAGSDVSSAEDEPESEFRPRNNDTIANGEDFSMIFMDSLPSLQANLRSSVQEVTENDIGEETSMIINNTLESLRQSLQERDKPKTDTEPAEAPKPSEPASSPSREEPRQPSIRPPLTFSPNRNLSPRWLRSPRRMGSSPLRRQVLELNARENADATRDEPEEHDSPVTTEARGTSVLDHEESNLYDDSFSEIPDAVLEAATPRRPRRSVRDETVLDETVLEDEDVEMEDDEPPQPVEEEEEEQPVEEEQQEQEQGQERQRELLTASNGSVVSRSDAGRLPTPDNTPPQLDAEEELAEKSIHMSVTSATTVSHRGSSPAAPSSGHSSTSQVQIIPEIVEEAVEEVVENNTMMDEPAEDVSDEDVPDMDLPDEDLSEEDEELPEIIEPPQPPRLSVGNEAHQPEVTPLNQMTSPLQDPQSLLPEAVSEKVSRPTLSPIVRAGRALQSVTSDPPSPETREQQLRSPFRSSVSRELGPRETQSNRRMSASPGRSLAFPAVTQIPPVDEAYEDPFGTATRHTGQPSFMEALERSGDPSPRRARKSSRESTASSMRFQPRSEDGMSWVENEGPISSNLRGDVPLEAFARSVVGKAKSPSVDRDQPDEAADDVDEEPEQDADDMDIWEFEAQRSSPAVVRQHSRERTVEAPAHRRGTLPSPWTKRTGREAQRDTAAVARESPKQAAEEVDQGEEPEEESEEEPQQEEDALVSDADGTEDAGPQSVEAEEYSLLAQRNKAQQQQNKAPESAVKASRFDLSAFFSSPATIPGMLAEKLLPVKKMSAPASRPVDPEPVEMEPVLPTSSMFPQLPQQELRPRAQPRAGFFSPVRATQPVVSRRHEEVESQGASTEPEEPEVQSEPEELDESEMPSVPQKRNFTPQKRNPRQSFFKASAQPAPAPAIGAPTPPRMQLSHADIQRWQQETSNASEDSPEPSQPILRPLPPRNASPTKSSLRSPLKPHTPGRVVEFTSSVLSPVEQAKARQQRRLSNSSAASQSSNPAQRPRLRLPPPRQNANKENAVASDVSMSEASPAAKPLLSQPLSKTLWTRQHWLFLDELLQLRRRGPYRTNYERRSDKFLGKTVKSQGEAMTLERWHLDCVDAFKAEVGGWDEAALAKRLFALILGEERRSRGVVDRPSRVMFH